MVAAAVERALHGDGTAIFLQAAAGFERTALLDRAALIAEGRGFMVRRATHGPVGRDEPYGAIRTLFERPVRDLDLAQRALLFDGAASYVCSLLIDGRTPAGDSASLVAHGIVWISALLSERAPLVLVVDDPQRIDRSSRDVLGYLARHIADIPVVMVT